MLSFYLRFWNKLIVFSYLYFIITTRGKFRALSVNYNGALCKNIKQISTGNYFCNKLIFAKIVNGFSIQVGIEKLGSSSPIIKGLGPNDVMQLNMFGAS